MEKKSFDQLFMELAVSLASKSHCIKRHVGAVLTKDTRIISIGYNGPPAGTHNCDEKWPENGCERDSKGGCSLAIHAEQPTAVAPVTGIQSVEGATLYVTLSPCLACARIILTMGVKKVIYYKSYAAYKGIDKDEGVDFLLQFGVDVAAYQGDISTAPDSLV